MNRKIIYLFLAILSIIGIGCLKKVPVQEPKKTGIEGRIVNYDQLLESAYVYAYEDSDFSKPPLFVSGPSRNDGRYDFAMPPGRYFITAKKTEIVPDSTENIYFSYFGGNPITIRQDEYSWVGLNCVKVENGDLKVSGNANKEDTVIKGRVTYQGRPLDGAYVYIYLDDKTDFKGPGFQTSIPTDKEGSFKFVNLPEGKYFLTARKRNLPGPSGPIQIGDFSGYFYFNPIDLHWGKAVEINIKCIVRAGEIGKEVLSIGSGDIIVRGKIIDLKGLPVKGIYAFLYKTSVIGHERPIYISNVTDESGEYEIRLKASGKYYMGARQVFGDSPRPGELYGLYDDTPDHSVTVEPGESKEKLNIKVQPILE
ncbi:MAG: carboxypeptidase-like regulatory domain-containing protein [bacterium]|nr:carboxypeptidase-like regulatory domain-containing protein [bacterium]